MSFISPKSLFFISVTFVSVNILLIPNMWDGVIYSHAFKLNDFGYLKITFTENSTHFFFLPFYFLFYLKNILHIPHEILFDIFTIISYILFCFEVEKLNKYLLNLNSSVLMLGSLLAASMPLWESLIAVIHGAYIFCIYLALLGHRLFVNKKDLKLKIIGILLILCSFSIKSNFVFILGLSLAFSLKKYFINKEKNYNFLFIFFLSFFSYFIDAKFFPKSGAFSNFNTPDFLNLRPEILLPNIYNYLTFFLAFLWLPALLLLKFKNKKNASFFDKNFYLIILIIAVIFGSATLPYLLIDRTTDIFFFRDWWGRHAFLIIIPYALFFSLIFEKCKSIFSNKIFNFLLILFFLECVGILGIKFYFKIEASLFRHNFVENLKKFDTPASGFLKFKKENGEIFSAMDQETYLPGHRFRNQEIGPYFHQAYGKEAWLFFVPPTKDGKKLNFSKYKKFFLAKDFNISNPCIVEIQFENSLNFYERIKKLYILNYKKYFNISSIKESC